MSRPRPCALYRYFDDKDRLLYIGITDNLAGREYGHVKSSAWMQFVASSKVKRYPEREDALVAERKAIQTERPLFNRQYNDTTAARERLKAYLGEIGRMDLYDPRRYTGNVPLGELEMMRARKRKQRSSPKPVAPSVEGDPEFEVRLSSRSQVVLITVAALQDTHLSLAARGLLALVISLPDGTEISTEWLASRGPDAEEAVFAALAELEACGYYRNGVISDGKLRQATTSAPGAA